MNTSFVIRGALVVVAVALLCWLIAVPAGAAEKSAGPFMPPASEMKTAPGDMPPSLDTPPAKGGDRSPAELGTGSERPMSFRDSEEGTGFFEPKGQTFDSDVLDHIRMEDEISSVSF